MDPYAEIREEDYKDYLSKLDTIIYRLDDPIWLMVSEKGRYSEEKLNHLLQTWLNTSIGEFVPGYQEDYLYVLLRIMTTEFDTHPTDDQPFYGYVHSVCPKGEREKITLKDVICNVDNEQILEIACMFYERFLGKAAEPWIVDFLVSASMMTQEYLKYSKSQDEYDEIDNARREEDPAYREEMEAIEQEGEAESDIDADELFQIIEKDDEEDRKAREEELNRINDSFPNQDKFLKCLTSFCTQIRGQADPHSGGIMDKIHVYGELPEQVKRMIEQYQKDCGATLFSNKEAMLDVNTSLIRAYVHAERYQSGEGSLSDE